MFSPVVIIDGAGNSSEAKHYEYLDNQLTTNNPQRITYYRLKQTDFNGAYTYSNIIALTANCKRRTVYCYPNPASDVLNLSLSSLGDEELTIEITDVTGRRVDSGQLAVSSGSTTINIRELPKGVYFLKVPSGNGQTVERFIKE